jgi:hypothetical protein
MLRDPSGNHRSVVEGLKLLVAQPVMSKMIVPERTRPTPNPVESVFKIAMSVVRILLLIPSRAFSPRRSQVDGTVHYLVKMHG